MVYKKENRDFLKYRLQLLTNYHNIYGTKILIKKSCRKLFRHLTIPPTPTPRVFLLLIFISNKLTVESEKSIFQQQRSDAGDN